MDDVILIKFQYCTMTFHFISWILLLIAENSTLNEYMIGLKYSRNWQYLLLKEILPFIIMPQSAMS